MILRRIRSVVLQDRRHVAPAGRRKESCFDFLELVVHAGSCVVEVEARESPHVVASEESRLGVPIRGGEVLGSQRIGRAHRCFAGSGNSA